MHFQDDPEGWKPALLALPDWSILKGFRLGTLMEAKLTWAAAGRDPQRLITVFRHFNAKTIQKGATWADAVEHWRRTFAEWADRTFYDQGLYRFVDFVSEANEYTAWTTWQDAADKAWAIQNVRSAAVAWNTYYRGKGGISDQTRIGLLAGTVSNGWPMEISKAAVETDNAIDYHAYEKCVDGVHVHDSWRWHAGLWHYQFQEHGVHPIVFFGESSPYFHTDGGWRHPRCLRSDRDKLRAVMRSFWRNIAATPGAQAGLVIGHGCWFTSRGPGWPYYDLTKDELIPLAQDAAATWRPPVPKWLRGEEPMDPQRKERIVGHLDAIRFELEAENAIGRVRVRVVVQVRDRDGRIVPARAGDPLTGLIQPGAVLDVFSQEHPVPNPDTPSQPWQRRLDIHPDGRNIWAANVDRV